MVYKEEYIDLFSVSEDYYLAHCVSADFALGAGIAVEFNKRFDMKNKLQKKYPHFLKYYIENRANGECVLEGRVFNLVTKERYWEKPTYESLRKALEMMDYEAYIRSIDKIAMPIIGCGLDKLKWNKVCEIIQDVFKNTDVEILVCKQ